jgi:hypothetical protein
MEFLEKARRQMEHWMAHNEQHQEEYEAFARQLGEAGRKKSAEKIREMARLAVRSNECLRAALEGLME